MADQATLESRLAVIRKGAAERFPQLLPLNDRLRSELEASVVENALNVGDNAPDFTLKRADTDESVRLSDALKNGPAVLSFYRGQW
jgi:hypothetical protein